mmetsp:Transcript_32046/g.44828  ORF Transcript_32046/g.44828 Transcript_32046/m.44828 type:complete len:517 (-) Transcript_32046:294-1844(-)
MSGSLTSEEVNFLVYRYLLESGFVHSAFAFGHESLIAKSNIDGSNITPGALISFIQKGLQFVEIEAHTNDDGTESICAERFSALRPHSCKVKSRKKIFDPFEDNVDDSGFGTLEASSEDVSYLKGHTKMVCSCAWHPNRPLLASGSSDSTVRLWDREAATKAAAASSNTAHIDKKMRTMDTNVVVVQMPSSKSNNSLQKRDPDTTADKSVADTNEKKQKEERPTESMVLTMEWNASGAQLATGCYNGNVYTWNEEGQLLKTFKEHNAPISVLRWNPKGNTFLTASIDSKAILWDASKGTKEHEFKEHTGPITDLDWQNDDTFATCSIDRKIAIWDLTKASSSSSSASSSSCCIAKLGGHAADINMIRWSPASVSTLASCSDDSLVKLWNVDSKACVQELTQHTREVCAIQWDNNSGHLASGSLDTTVRIWEAESGKCLQTFTKHLHPVSCISFSPDYSLLASASHDRIYVWSIKDDTMVKTLKAGGGINAISWDSTGKKLAGGCANHSVCTLDMRR